MILLGKWLGGRVGCSQVWGVARQRLGTCQTQRAGGEPCSVGRRSSALARGLRAGLRGSTGQSRTKERARGRCERRRSEAGLRGQGTCSWSPLCPPDGTLYSGTMNNFLGSEPILIRTLGPQPVLKTDTFLRWLQRKWPSPAQRRSGPSRSRRAGDPLDPQV